MGFIKNCWQPCKHISSFSTFGKMASSGKKGKKNKGTVISLQSFLSNGDAPTGTTQVSKKIRNVDGDDSDDGSNSMPLVYQLPTAPRANRIFDDDSIPHKPPFIAYLTNLPFDANEDDINAFLGSFPIVSLRLPREDGDTGRVRGFGYVEFETRDDLIDVLSLPDPSIKGRRIRIELSNENEQQNNRQRGNRRGFEGFGNSGENRDSTNWRRDNQSQDAGGFGNNYDRGFNRDRKYTQEDNGAPGSWRTASRSLAQNMSPRSDRGVDRPRDTNSRTRHFDRDEREKIGTSNTREDEPVQERPKLNLKPRTLPLPEIVTKVEPEIERIEKEEDEKPVKFGGVAPEKVFGSAKPVDTASRELEIEERLSEARRQEKLRQVQEHDDVNEKLGEIRLEKTDKENTNSAISWRRRNDPVVSNKSDGEKSSPDRIGHSKLDDRRRDNREKDFSHYNKNRDRNERTESTKGRSQQTRDGKQRDDSKSKREVKTERSLPKYQPNQSGPVLQSSNKYSGLDDEGSD